MYLILAKTQFSFTESNSFPLPLSQLLSLLKTPGWERKPKLSGTSRTLTRETLEILKDRRPGSEESRPKTGAKANREGTKNPPVSKRLVRH